MVNWEEVQNTQRTLARIAMGISTVRGLGPAGMMMETSRSFLGYFDIRSIKARSEKEFCCILDLMTGELILSLPDGGDDWGSARKFVNIFLRHCAHNVITREAYRLDLIEPWLEVPLDSHVASGLRKYAGDFGLMAPPRWKTIRGLTQDVSEEWQATALQVEKCLGTERVRLDYWLWNGDHLKAK